MKPKVVYDTNVLISALLFGGNPRLCLELARAGRVVLHSSVPLLTELSRKLQFKFGWSANQVESLILGMKEFVEVVSPKEEVKAVIDDPSDNRVLECALAAEVSCVVTGDTRHILPLKLFHGIEILSPVDFLVKYKF